MEVRGVRECKACGTQWSYFETGSTACPDCGSMHSVGVGERRLHTDSPVDLDLAEARTLAADDSLREAAEAAADAAREYIRKRGFIDAGDLKPLDETYVAAQELRHVGSELARRLSVSEDEEYYFGALLDGISRGDRPSPDAVPASIAGARGLAAAGAVRAYREDLRTWLDHVEADADVQSLFERLGSHVRRVRALDGAIEPETADRLVAAAQALGSYLRTGEEESLERARSALDALQ